MDFNIFGSQRVSSILYSFPICKVMKIPNIQIKIVLQTSASERETGLIRLETVTATGTEIAIDKINPMLNAMRSQFEANSLKNVEML